MRTIDVEGLECLGREGQGPWRLDDGRLLHVASGKPAIPTEEGAKRIFDAYRIPHEAGAPTPDAYEIVRVRDGFGVIIDYVDGVPLPIHIGIGTIAPHDAGIWMASLLRELNAYPMDAGIDMAGKFAGLARNMAALLREPLGKRLVELVDDIPQSRTLIHGDLHMSNVVIYKGKMLPIDMELAGFGHPVFDLAIARSRILGDFEREGRRLKLDPEMVEKVSKAIWDGFLEGSFEGATPDELARRDRALSVLAMLDANRFAFLRGRMPTSPGLKGLLGSTVAALEAQLPDVDCLWA